MKTDDTVVVGINKNKQIEFFKSYRYEIEKEQAQNDLTYVMNNYPTWYISNMSEWLLTNRDGDEYKFNPKEY